MATNAFLSWSLGSRYNVTLLGLAEMPKPGISLTPCMASIRMAFLPCSRRGLMHRKPRLPCDCMTGHGVVAETKLSLDFASLLGPIFFTWLVQQLLPFMLVTLVTEKERGCVLC